jgi:hypothetical protein
MMRRRADAMRRAMSGTAMACSRQPIGSRRSPMGVLDGRYPIDTMPGGLRGLGVALPNVDLTEPLSPEEVEVRQLAEHTRPTASRE